MKSTILIVDDEKNTREGLARALRREHTVFLAESAAKALETLAKEHIDVMLSDVRMPGESGLELLKAVRAKYPDVVCILLTAYGNVETAVEAMKLGANDFLTKPVNLDHLDILLERSLRQRRLETENLALKKQLDSKFGLENIIGHSPAMERMFTIIKQAAPTQATVLIQGASGTGKELVANAIHRLSTRANGPFIPVHCAALSATLLESELFGHEKGAFTGAVAQRKGRFEMADGGTLFLDEISEIEPSVQVKLLRVLEERRFERVGGHESVDVDIRVIAATNRDLRAYVDEGKFREDLYYRLDVVSIRIPPLRDRDTDIPILCDHFVREFAARNGRAVTGITPDAMAMLQSYPWPGNVRELRNTIEKMVVLATTDKLTPADIPANVAAAAAATNAEFGVRSAEFSADSATRAPENENSALRIPNSALVSAAPAAETLADVEKRKILDALAAANGNRSKAALALGISRRTLHRKLKEWNMSGETVE